MMSMLTTMGSKGFFTKDIKGWMECEFEGGHEGIQQCLIKLNFDC